ncbi:uncharacterized protein LOC132752743 isoform X1 [Ruditapes philippinarum]|uniref:uncharacterized protein LOC132752743 isoform X1 n=1 Tax=Ruditapes philippinarum TaxID=129788 RepID=UPI00295B921B|nr:uncharacterized protein LOC132752743 isoform X1 [Ruditapes philippinarum]
MQLQVFIPLCLVFLCVVDSRNADFQRRHFPPGSREVTTEEPIPTESYPSSPDNEVPDVDIPEIDYENWPYAMMEFSSLVGRCVTARLVKGRSPNKPQRQFLSFACPRIFEAARHYAESEEGEKDKIEEFAEKSFGLLQCANLYAEKENVEAVRKMMKSGPKRSRHFSLPGLRAESTVTGDWSVEEMSKVLFEESRELYDLCAKTFNDASISVDEQNMDMQRANTPAKRFIFITMGIIAAAKALG